MGEIAAREKDRPPSELLCHAGDAPSEHIVLLGREPRDADAHETKARRVRLKEGERHHDPVIERGTTPADAACCDPLGGGRLCELLGKGLIVVRHDAQIGRAERCEVPRRHLARRDVEIVRVHHRVRARDDHRLGCELRRLLHRALVGVLRQLELSLRALPHLRQQERRVRQGVCGNDGHGTASSFLYYGMNSTCGAKALHFVRTSFA